MIMETLIQVLSDALKKSENFLENVQQDRHYYFKENYTVAVVHHQKRIKEEETVRCLKNKTLLDAQGYTPNSYDATQLAALTSCAPNYVKKVRLMCFSSEADENYTFKEKYAGDYWKKIVDPGSFEAVIEYASYTNGEDICKIEFELRELMRSSKEVPSLKVLPYIWVARVSSDVEITKILKHYYEDNFEIIEGEGKRVAIGWSSSLQSVNMRYFVCPPA
jgi:hypothetical protein